MKRLFKILKRTVLIIVLVFVALMIYVMNIDYAPIEDYGEEIASFDLYYDACSEDFQGTNRIYLKDTIYTMKKYNEPAKEMGKEMALLQLEWWSAVDVEEERRKSMECVEKGKALRRERSKKKRSEEKREKEIKEAIETLLDN
tara:strand:- start:48 stop:476 length:429 start_codon:yes stop_codon:yes gene_type:complete